MSVWYNGSAREQQEALRENAVFQDFIDRCSSEMQRFYERINAFSQLSTENSYPEAEGFAGAAEAEEVDESEIPGLLQRRLQAYRDRIAGDQEKRAAALYCLSNTAESIRSTCKLARGAVVQHATQIAAAHQEINKCCFRLAALVTARVSSDDRKISDKITRLEDGNCALANANEKLQAEVKALRTELYNERQRRDEAEGVLKNANLAYHVAETRSGKEYADLLLQKQRLEDGLAAEKAAADKLRLESAQERARAERYKENAGRLQYVVEKDDGVIKLLQKQIGELEGEIIKKNKQLVARKQYIEGIQSDIDSLTAQMGNVPQKPAKDVATQEYQNGRRLTFGVPRGH